MMRMSIAVLLASLSSLLSACGGGSGQFEIPEVTPVGGNEPAATATAPEDELVGDELVRSGPTLTAPGVPLMDGRIARSVVTNRVEFFRASEPLAGDLRNLTIYRALFTFDLSGLPEGARVLSARLRLHQTGTSGDPFAGRMEDLRVDHVDTEGFVESDDQELFYGYALETNIGTLSDTPAVGTRTLSVTAQVRNDVGAGRSTSQYRVYFRRESDLDESNDLTGFVGSEDPNESGDTPVLEINYRLVPSSGIDGPGSGSIAAP